MKEKEVNRILVNELTNNQILNGISTPQITDATVPVGDLASFDSLTAIEVLAAVEMKINPILGREVSIDVSVFFTDQGRSNLKKGMTYRSQSVLDIAKNICKAIKKDR